jgi:hypothetical protein
MPFGRCGLARRVLNYSQVPIRRAALPEYYEIKIRGHLDLAYHKLGRLAILEMQERTACTAVLFYDTQIVRFDDDWPVQSCYPGAISGTQEMQK